VGLLKDALDAKKRLDGLTVVLVDGIENAEAKTAPIKNVERAMVKVYEKYGSHFEELTDLARATIVCADEHVLLMVLKKLEKEVNGGRVAIRRIKHRLCAKYDATEAGGYRDVLINVSETNGGHIAELQLNLGGFVAIKSSGGHRACECEKGGRKPVIIYSSHPNARILPTKYNTNPFPLF
jgi:hypothetical protein